MGMKLTKKESITINYLKGIAIFLVLFDHVFSYYSRTTELSNFINTLLDMIRYVHIPLFFVLAGFVCHRQPVNAYLKKKVVRILVPFYFFTVLKLIYSNLISNEFAHADSILSQLYDAFVLGETYWFAYAICLVYFVAPLFWEKDETAIPQKAIIAVICLSLFNIVYYGMHWHFLKIIFQFRNAIFYLPFFLLGYIIRYFFVSFKAILENKKGFFFIIATSIIVVVTVMTYKNISSNLFITKFMASFALMFYLTQLCRILPENLVVLGYAGENSWQLMLLDAFYKAILFSVISRFINVDYAIVVVVVFLDFFLGLLTCKIAKNLPVICWLMGLDNLKNFLWNIKGGQ